MCTQQLFLCPRKKLRRKVSLFIRQSTSLRGYTKTAFGRLSAAGAMTSLFVHFPHLRHLRDSYKTWLSAAFKGRSCGTESAEAKSLLHCLISVAISPALIWDAILNGFFLLQSHSHFHCLSHRAYVLVTHVIPTSRTERLYNLSPICMSVYLFPSIMSHVLSKPASARSAFPLWPAYYWSACLQSKGESLNWSVGRSVAANAAGDELLLRTGRCNQPHTCRR